MTKSRITPLIWLGAFGMAYLPVTVAATSSAPAPDREVLLSLPWKEFDQTQNSGWRIFVNPTRKEYLIAAKLMEDYLARHKDLTARQRVIIHYHAAHQYIYRAVRTNEGDVRDAFPHLDSAIIPENEEAPSIDWNEMVIATKAFLAGDRATLLAVRSRVAALSPEAVRYLKSPHAPEDLLKNLGKPYGSWFPQN